MVLKGIKVLELAGLAPGPFCGMVLADFGASVIRIDKIGAQAIDSLGHGKRSIALNLKSKEGIEIFKKLSNQSDVIIDTYRRGVMEKLKIGPKDLMTSNKKLIYARLTGFGQVGPYADMAGHDINYLGLSGLLSLFGRYNEKPTPPVNLAADFGGGGLMCAFGIILALYERYKSNVGQVVDASMVEGSAYLGSWLFRSQKMPFLWGRPRGKNILDSGVHFYDTYETKDNRYMCVGALEPQFYEIFLKKLGLTSDEVSQFENFEENRCRITEIFKQKTQAEWCAIFDGTDACVTPLLSLKDAASHIHNQYQGTFTTIGDDVIPNPSPRLSRTPGISTGTRKNSQPGENSIEILTELKYQTKEINYLLSNNFVYQTEHISKI
ncbi:alpha-methylacyl-CoA racemase [Harpegnathos saltator]|uniref:Alpha-methylacyl-CoA racemase n=1 Tax=Harpegnathos saltator TaxID=610380 RepID=E2CAE7_HARSA|nr:alpha-methylacyl-CoA racemase [Harpegnathos saltator]EFN75058.1 Alpha-methylacyl-CoA racemase [Harpegnathos saltator]